MRELWQLAGPTAPDADADGQVTVGLDGVFVIAHSVKQDAKPTWKKTFGHHPLIGFVDHGSADPVSLPPVCCDRATQASRLPPTTSRPPDSPWPSYRSGPGADARP